ncbi:MAG: hypothetical protein ACFE95_02440 [Candidatus Hodarchaeota archaeon]
MNKLLNQAKEIVKYLVNKVDDIDLIYIYGGIAQGREHPRSDIEMVAVSQERLFRWEFILNGRPIFIWPYSWEQLEQISTGRNGFWSVAGASIVYAKILWTKSTEKHAKFKEIQKKSMLGAESALRRSIISFDGLYGKLWRIQKAIETERRGDTTFLIWDLVKEIVNILAALNNKFLLHNWGQQLQEIDTFNVIPHNFSERYLTLIQSEPEEALKIASDLVDEVKLLLKKFILDNHISFNEDLEEIVTDWPTVLEFLNKAITAEEHGDLSAGLFASSDNAWFNLWAFTTLRNSKWDTRSFFSASDEIKSLPNDIANNLTILLESKNLSEIRQATSQLSEQLRTELQNAGWTLPECSSLEEAFRFLKIQEN